MVVGSKKSFAVFAPVSLVFEVGVEDISFLVTFEVGAEVLSSLVASEVGASSLLAFEVGAEVISSLVAIVLAVAHGLNARSSIASNYVKRRRTPSGLLQTS